MKISAISVILVLLVAGQDASELEPLESTFPSWGHKYNNVNTKEPVKVGHSMKSYEEYLYEDYADEDEYDVDLTPDDYEITPKPFFKSSPPSPPTLPEFPQEEVNTFNSSPPSLPDVPQGEVNTFNSSPPSLPDIPQVEVDTFNASPPSLPDVPQGEVNTFNASLPAQQFVPDNFERDLKTESIHPQENLSTGFDPLSIFIFALFVIVILIFVIASLIKFTNIWEKIKKMFQGHLTIEPAVSYQNLL